MAPRWTACQGHGVRATLLALTLLLVPASASAQQDLRVDPETGERYRLVRPPEGPARGRWAAPTWVVWTVGGLVFGGATAALARRLRRRKR